MRSVGLGQEDASVTVRMFRTGAFESIVLPPLSISMLKLC